MITISLCMIVKNESQVLSRCLDSVSDLVDEIVIVDTGSTDETKKIASLYTDKVYDFEWVGDFSAARNHAFSLCSCDYIYSADADEILDETNRERFKALKETLDPEVEIVQMYYANQLENGSVYNFDKELRPKLFKRVRNFTWIERVHETVRTEPLVFDSEIEITHKPLHNHATRDYGIFEDMISKGEKLSPRLFDFYARELFVSGEKDDFAKAEDYFTAVADDDETDLDRLKTALCIVVKAAYWRKDFLKMYRYAIKDVAMESCSEICFLMGSYYEDQRDYKEAAIWYYNAAFECTSVLNIKYQKEYPLQGLIDVYNNMGLKEQALEYEKLLNEA
ncbi:MAG: glycosyltransferase family 2 protein [Lachnospiraceae bacterium]|nr:glycosyltransferase family 2 protein [Lachnospiraceae bacterium]